MAKIVENGKITVVEGTIMEAHKQFMRENNCHPKEVIRSECNRYVGITYRTSAGERTIYIWA